MDLHSAVALSTISGLTRTRAFAAYKELQEQDPAISLEAVIACASPGANAARVADEARERASLLVASAARACIGIVQWHDDFYPAMLRAISDPPPLLWVSGRPEVLLLPAVA